MNIFNKYQTTMARMAGLLLLLAVARSYGQKEKYLPVIIGFYNLENLYDTIHNTEVDDLDFLVAGKKRYSGGIYTEKIGHIARVISEMGTGEQRDGLALLGVAEVENDTVLNAIRQHPLLRQRELRFVHFDSKDRRGVDVALFYNPRYFQVKSAHPLFVPLPAGSKGSVFTRDILYVEGELLGEKVHVYVNHWPSRVGGEKKSYPARATAARTVRRHIRLILDNDSLARFIVMGDLNDEPVSKSVVEDLGAAGTVSLKDTLLFNPWVEKYKKGLGTLAYRNGWSLFDQILLDPSWCTVSDERLFFHRSYIFKPEYLVEKNGNYKGYPKRTYSGDNYQHGYSDHFPVYIQLLKCVSCAVTGGP